MSAVTMESAWMCLGSLDHCKFAEYLTPRPAVKHISDSGTVQHISNGWPVLAAGCSSLNAQYILCIMYWP